MKFWLSLLCFAVLIVSITATRVAWASDPVVPARNAEVRDDPSTIQTQGYRSGRGGFSGVRPPTNRGGATTTPGAPNNPARNPAAGTPPAGRGFGGMIGGFALGTLLGSLFNPLGFMGLGPGAGTSLSFIGLLFWAVVIYFIYRFFRRTRKQTP